MYINKAILYGNITRDPELRAMPSGQNVCSFSMATHRTYKDRDGKKQEQTDFHNVVVFGKTADTVAQYMKKGSAIYVEGRIQTRSWEQNGEKKYRTEVVSESIQFGPKRDSGSAPASSSQKRDEGVEIGADDVNPDEIPF